MTTLFFMESKRSVRAFYHKNYLTLDKLGWYNYVWILIKSILLWPYSLYSLQSSLDGKIVRYNLWAVVVAVEVVTAAVC